MYRMEAIGIRKAKRLADQYSRLAIAKILPGSDNNGEVAHIQSGASRAVLKATGANILRGRGAYNEDCVRLCESLTKDSSKQTTHTHTQAHESHTH